MYTHEQCEYREGEWPHECGTCAHFAVLTSTGDVHPNRSLDQHYRDRYARCKIVQSPISEHGVCNFWTTGKLTELGTTREDISI